MSERLEGIKVELGIESYGYDELEEKIKKVQECSDALNEAINALNEHEIKISIKN